MREAEEREITKYEVIGPLFVVGAKQKQRAVCLLGEKFLQKSCLNDETGKHLMVIKHLMYAVFHVHSPVMLSPQTVVLYSS